MTMILPRPARLLVIALGVVPFPATPACAQHDGHEMPGMRADSVASTTAHVMAQAIPLRTRADPGAGGARSSQFALRRCC